MKLSELEERARQEQEEAASLAAEQEAEKHIAAAEAAEEFKREVIAWMVEEGDLDDDELGATLSVVDREYKKVRLRVIRHTGITFQLIRADEGFAVRDGQFNVERAHGYDRCCYSLSDALLVASEEWQEREEQEKHEAEREAKRQAERELRVKEAAERGAKYQAILDDHPILQPILDILGAFMEERERFEHDLEMADEFAEHTEARHQERLEQAQYEADRYARERDDLQRDLWDAEDELRKKDRGR